MKKLLLILSVPVIFVGAYFFLNKNQNNKYSPSITPTESTTKNETSDPIIKEGWETYESPRFNYKISYPKNWHTSFWDESDETVITGSHTFTNYDTEKIEQFMNHGIVDWQKFLGEKVAIKFDLAVEKVGENNLNDFIDQYFKNAVQQPTSDISIGNLNTIQYNTESSEKSELLRSYLAFIPDGRVVFVSVVIRNLNNKAQFKDTNEWKEFGEILSTFTYN